MKVKVFLIFILMAFLCSFKMENSFITVDRIAFLTEWKGVESFFKPSMSQIDSGLLKVEEYLKESSFLNDSVSKIMFQKEHNEFCVQLCGELSENGDMIIHFKFFPKNYTQKQWFFEHEIIEENKNYMFWGVNYNLQKDECSNLWIGNM